MPWYSCSSQVTEDQLIVMTNIRQIFFNRTCFDKSQIINNYGLE